MFRVYARVGIPGTNGATSHFKKVDMQGFKRKKNAIRAASQFDSEIRSWIDEQDEGVVIHDESGPIEFLGTCVFRAEEIVRL